MNRWRKISGTRKLRSGEAAHALDRGDQEYLSRASQYLGFDRQRALLRPGDTLAETMDSPHFEILI